MVQENLRASGGSSADAARGQGRGASATADQTLAGPRSAADSQYGGDTLAVAVEFYTSLTATRSRVGRLLKFRDLRGVLALIALIARSPRVCVELTDSSAGRAIGAHLRYRNPRRPPANRVLQGALRLPHSPMDYRRGRSRQALRTNVHRAEAMGLTCQRVDSSELTEVTESRLLRDSEHRHLLWDIDSRTSWVVRDGSGEPIGLGLLAVDRKVALMLVLECNEHAGRWLLSLTITEDLIASGVKVLLVNSPHVLQMTPEIRYVQQLLGYEVVHLSLADAPAVYRHGVGVVRSVARMLLRRFHPRPAGI